MKLRFSSLRLVLAGLLVLLVFGNCGGGVYAVLSELRPAQRRGLQRVMQQQRRAREAVRPLPAGARWRARHRINLRTARRLDSLGLAPYQQDILFNRWRQTERQLPQWLQRDTAR